MIHFHEHEPGTHVKNKWKTKVFEKITRRATLVSLDEVFA